MEWYKYSASDNNGRVRKGTIQCSSPRQVREALREQGLMPLDISLQKQRPGNSGHFLRLKGTGRISASHITLFTRQLATLVNASLPLEQALRIVSQQTETPAVADMISNLREQVTEGQSLGKAMQQWSGYFDNRYRTMIAAGESTGNLGEVLSRLADDNEIRQKTRNKLLQALIYPATLTVVAVSVIIILLVAVVPQVIEQFTQFKQQLPLTTRILITVSDALMKYGLYLAFLAGTACLLMVKALNTPSVREKLHRYFLVLPAVGSLLRATDATRYVRTLSIMQVSSVPLLDAMRIASESVSNSHIHTLLIASTEQVRQGGILHKALEQAGIFPPMMIHMIASGEETGQLGTLMQRAAENQEHLLQHRITLVLSVFEPALVVGMSLVVLFIVMSILQPILQLNTMF